MIAFVIHVVARLVLEDGHGAAGTIPDPTSKTKCELTVAHDSDQTNDNAGTIEERVTYTPTHGRLDNGGRWTAEPLREFVIGCPEKKKQ